jgi:phenylacetate-CoA ligase
VAPVSAKLSNSGHHAWPAIRLGGPAELAALVAELDRIQWLTGEQIRAHQFRQLKVLLGYLENHSPFFADRLKSAGLTARGMASLDDLRRIPILSRADIQLSGKGFFTTTVPKDQGRLGETQTSGSTGEPVHVRKTGVSQLYWNAVAVRNHQWHRVPFQCRYAIIRPTVERLAVQPDWGGGVAQLYRTGTTQLIPMSTSISEQAGLLAGYRPEILLVYPSNLRGLLDHWQEHGDAPEGLRFIRTIGETLTDDLRHSVTEALDGVSVINGYSSQECGTMALQCPDGAGYHVMSESHIVEVLDENDEPCGPGETGRIVVTDLHNLASPLVRYDIGDYAVVGTPCACGRGLDPLERILGRRRNLVVTPDGERHWPLVGFHYFGDIAPVRQYQMIQETVEQITVRFVTDEPLTDVQKEAFTSLIQGALGYPFELDIRDQRERLPRQTGGKFEEFISRVA